MTLFHTHHDDSKVAPPPATAANSGSMPPKGQSTEGRVIGSMPLANGPANAPSGTIAPGASTGAEQTTAGIDQRAPGLGADSANPHHQNDPLYSSPNARITDQDYERVAEGHDVNEYAGGPPAGIGGVGAGPMPSEGHSATVGHGGHEHGHGHGHGHDHSHPSALMGKVEAIFGSVIGSHRLHEEGEEKQREAAALKAEDDGMTDDQKRDREERGRHEREAAARASPDHGHLGGQTPGAGATNVNEIGGFANNGVTGAVGAK